MSSPHGWRWIFRALRHRNYALFFTGQGVSLVGTWMQQVAMSWLVYRLTHSAMLLGVIGFCSQFPTFLFASFAGVWVDHTRRRPLVILTQTLAMAQALALALLTLGHVVAVWHLVVLGLLLGLVNAVDMPARQAFLVDLVADKDDLGNAIALNSSLVNAARLIGPSLAGVLIAWVGEGWCFLFNAVSFLAVIAALAAMRLVSATPAPPAGGAWEAWKRGVSYVLGFRPILVLLALLGVISLTGTPYTVLMPIFATQVLGGGPHTLGFLMAASGLGALAGAVFLASRRNVLGLGRVIGGGAVTFGGALVVFGLSRWLWLSLALMAAAGFAMIVQMAASNTILQTIVEDDKRGRVMSFFAMAFLGTAPIGSLYAGWVASRIGAPATVVIGGAVCLAGGACFFLYLPRLRALIRPIYQRMGLLPDVASALQQASALARLSAD